MLFAWEMHTGADPFSAMCPSAPESYLCDLQFYLDRSPFRNVSNSNGIQHLKDDRRELITSKYDPFLVQKCLSNNGLM